MAIDEWIEKAQTSPETRRSKQHFRRLGDGDGSALGSIESLARRLDDRLSYHEKNRKSHDRITINLVGFKELRKMLFLLLAQVHHWKNDVWPKAQGAILAKGALGSLENYKELYYDAENRYRRLAKVLADTRTMMTEEEVDGLLERLEARSEQRARKSPHTKYGL